MKSKIGVVLVAFLTVLLAILPVYAGVDYVNISPSVLAVGQPITFFGGASGSSVDNQIGVYVFVGPNCPPDNVFASTYTVANSTDTYSVTLSFPVDLEYSGWKVEQQYQQYQNGLPAGSYSVGVADMASVSSGSGGVCRNFTVSPQPLPEFSGLTVTILLTLIASLYVLRFKRGVSPNR
jgi:hypothetical protein